MEERKDICAAIIEDAEKYSSDLCAAAEEYAKNKLKEAEYGLQAFALNQEAASQKEIDEIFSKNAAAERMEEKNIMLSAKVDLISEVYDRLKSKLASTEKGELLRFYDSLIEKYASCGDEIVIARNSELSEDDFRQSKVVQKLGLNVTGGGDFIGGFMIRNASYDRDFSFESVVKAVREQTEAEISAKLFE